MNDKTEIDGGGTVYPQVGVVGDGEILMGGITRRDWLAGLAMQGLLSNPNTKLEITGETPFGFDPIKKLSIRCIEIADAMIA